MINKAIHIAENTWKFLEGKKRRISFTAGIIMALVKPGTAVHVAAEICFYLFGGTDIAISAKKLVKKKES